MSFSQLVEEKVEMVKPESYKYLKEQNYFWINSVKEAKKEAALLKKAASKNVRIVFDSEEDYLDSYGKIMPLVMGTCAKPGRVGIFCLYHPDGRAKKDSEVEGIKKVVADLLHDKHVAKCFHHGVSDCNAAQSMYGVTVRGEIYDTEYAEFFTSPGRFSYGLKIIANHRFPKFTNYAHVVMPHAVPKELPAAASDKLRAQVKLKLKKSVFEQYNFFRKLGLLRYSQLTQKQMTLYNGADNDLTKRIELTTKQNISLALLKVYTDSAFILNEMEHNGPIFDYTHYEKLQRLYPPRLKAALYEVRKRAGKTFNPASPPQVYNYLFNIKKMKYPFPLKRDEKINTKKGVIEFFARTDNFCKHLLIVRKLSKIVSTYLGSYYDCANAHGGRLQTRWWLTGTGTGRLSSGGTKGESVDKVVNLQNVHGDPLLQDQLVPDKNWRKLYDHALKYFKRVVGSTLTSQIEDGKEVAVDKIKARLKGSTWKKYCLKLFRLYGDVRVFLGFDFGQIEVRVVAQLSGDKNLIKDCESGDIHSAVGHAMTGWAVEKIKKDKLTRTLTKNIHFGMLFGLNVDGLYNFIKQKDPDTKVTREDVERYVAKYFARYPGVKILIAKLRKMAEENGYVENMFGFRRPLNVGGKDGGDDEEGRGAYWGNQAINTPVQGAAHHLMLMAVATLKRKREYYEELLGKPSMEVHDSLYFFIRLRDIAKAFPMAKQLLTKEPLNVVKKDFPKVDFKIALEVEGKLGFRLGDQIEAEADGKMFSIPDLLGSMVLETFMREKALDRELAAYAS